MDVEWTVAQPAPGRAAGVDGVDGVAGVAGVDGARTLSDDAAYQQLLDSLLELRSGYTEVSRAGSDYPLLGLSINGDLGVVRRLDEGGRWLVLQGTGLVGADETYDFPVPDRAQFAGELISTSVRAAETLRAFARGADIDGLGTWVELADDPPAT
ncbi:hypothetical protein GCM10027053_16740 [Intrasporangium mesophilum]